MTSLSTPDSIAIFTLSADKTQLTVIEDGESTHLDREQAMCLSKALTNMGADLKRLAKKMEGQNLTPRRGRGGVKQK
tara:strand:+ start:406 stop:636 length:231 start_codon:yes stop_codon:yes gene_type:complete